MNIEEANDNLIMLKYFLQEEGDENWEKYCEAIETLLTAYDDIKTEHKIMKRIIVENGLWERLLNDDEFIKHLKEE